MTKVSTERSKKKHHRVKKLLKLAALAGAAYGAKKYWESKKNKSAGTRAK